MYCLAGIGGDVSAIVTTTEAADELVAVDGCPVSCAAATLRRAGFDRFGHVVVTELGLHKGDAPATVNAVGRVARAMETQWSDKGGMR